MKTIQIILPALLLATSGFAQDVRYNFATGQDFSKYKTYKWVQTKGADQLDQLADQQLKAAVDEELTKKGLIKTEGDNADLFLAYQVSLDQEKQFTSNGMGYGPGRGRFGGMTTITTSTIQVGQLDLDMYDAAAKQLVWRGVVSKTLDPKAKPDKRQKNLQKAVAKLLNNYPPTKKT